MSISSKGFVKHFVIGIGFLGGLFARAGLDPKGEIIKALISVFQSNPLLFGLISVVFTVLPLFIAYLLGGALGMFAIILAFFGGYLISSSLIGIILLIIAIVLGLIAPYEKHP
jgi:hypothetical protein